MNAVNRTYLGSTQTANATSRILLDVGKSAQPRPENFFNLALIVEGGRRVLHGMAKPNAITQIEDPIRRNGVRFNYAYMMIRDLLHLGQH
jgi:hypothetical protein